MKEEPLQEEDHQEFQEEDINNTTTTMDIHPLLIDHVVENILQSMDPELVGYYCKLFRLVCKDWTRIATKVYKTKRGKITFKKNFIGRVSGLFIRVMKTSANIPFEKFRFASDSYDNDNFDELLHVCSSSITSLELNFVNPSNLKFPRNLCNLVLSKLKTLIFHVRIDSRGPIQAEMHTLLDSLLEASPNLMSLDLKIYGGVNHLQSTLNAHRYIGAMRNFGNVLCGEVPKNLRHIKLHMTVTDGQLRAFTQHDLKIQTLDLYFQQSQLTKKSMEEFLGKFAPNILFCKALGNQFLNNIEFPVFPKLRTFVAVGKPPPFVQYQKLFPAIEKLEVCLWNNSDDIFPQNCYSPSLNHIQFPFMVSSPLVISRMAQCFPNLKKLTGITICSLPTLKMIFRSLLQLEELEITLGYDFHGVDSVDFAFTGIPDLACATIMKYKEFQENIPEQIKGWINGESLRDLKELRYLSICTSPLTYPGQVKLSDMTVYYGFLQLKHLKRLHLDYFPISTNGLEKLQKKVHLTRPC